MVLSNSKSMHTRIQNSEISIQGLQVQYSTSYSNKYNSINSTIRNRLLLQLFISEMIHAKQWHYSLQQRLPEASFHSFYMKNPRNSSSINSTSRRQRALRVILHAEGKEIFYPVYKAFQSFQTFQSFQAFQSFQTFQTFMTFQPYKHLYTFQHLPVQTSTFQCYPVYPVYPGIPPVPAFL